MGHANTAVSHTELEHYVTLFFLYLLDTDFHTALAGELDCVVGKIDENLAKAEGVAFQPDRHIGGQLNVQLQPFFVRLEADDIRKVVKNPL